MQRLCRRCPNDCKDTETGNILKFCAGAPEGYQLLEPARRGKNANRKTKKTKSSKSIPTGSGEVVWDATDWKGYGNKPKGTERPVEHERQDGKVADL